MAGCEDLWEAQFPNEIGDWQGHSCSYKKQWGQCEQFGEFCAKTCEMCNASPSAPGSVSIRLLLMAAAIFIAFALLAIASAWLLGAFADMQRNRQRRRTSSGSRSTRRPSARRAQRYRRQEAEDVEDYVVELEAPVEMDDDGEPRVPPLRKDRSGGSREGSFNSKRESEQQEDGDEDSGQPQEEEEGEEEEEPEPPPSTVCCSPSCRRLLMWFLGCYMTVALIMFVAVCIWTLRRRAALSAAPPEHSGL